MRTKLFETIKSPLVLNGYALVFSSAATSVLGVIYWILAARLYSEEVVGLNSATLAAMFFLTNLSQFNLVHALNRFVPLAGKKTRNLVLTSYLATVLMSVATGAIFLLGLNVWAPSLSLLNSSPVSVMWFIGAIVSWCIFTLQDGVLVGLRQAKWVPLSTITYAVIKIAMIALFAATFPRAGIFMSWTAPAVLLIVPINVFIFLRLIPAHAHVAGERSQIHVPEKIVRFVAGDYLSSLVWMATINLLPLFVLEQVGAASSAYFYLAWNITNALYLISTNMSMSLVTEGSLDEERLNRYSFQTLSQTMKLILPAVTIIVLGAPYILKLYGASYAADGVMLLRLLSLSAIPFAVISIYIGMVRVRRKIMSIFIAYSAVCASVLTLSYIFLNLYGVTGVGLAWLIGLSFVMIILFVIDLWKAWLPHFKHEGKSLSFSKE